MGFPKLNAFPKTIENQKIFLQFLEEFKVMLLESKMNFFIPYLLYLFLKFIILLFQVTHLIKIILTLISVSTKFNYR